MKNIIAILFLFSIFLSCTISGIKYEIPPSMKPNFFCQYQRFIFISSDSSLKDTITIYENIKFELIDDRENYYERDIINFVFKDKKLRFLERYNPRFNLIKKNVLFNLTSDDCNCEQFMTGEYIGDYQLGNIIYKDVIKYTDCSCIKEVYYNVYFGLICYTDKNNNLFTYYKPF